MKLVRCSSCAYARTRVFRDKDVLESHLRQLRVPAKTIRHFCSLFGISNKLTLYWCTLQKGKVRLTCDIPRFCKYYKPF